MTIEKKLDEVLKVLIEIEDNKPMIADEIRRILEGKNIQMSENEVFILLEHLRNIDAHADYIITPNVKQEYKIKFLQWYITIKGKLFEGYETTTDETKNKRKIEKRKSNILFIGSSIAGCYSLFKIGEIIYHLICNCQ